MPNWTLYEGDCLEVMRELPSSHALTKPDPATGARKFCGLSQRRSVVGTRGA